MPKHTIPKSGLLLLATTALVGAAGGLTGARAQAPAAGTGASAPAGKGKAGIEEVVVTATRVSTKAQRTPVALNVYSSAQLLRQGVHSVLQLQSIDPSVNISTATGASSVAIRGVASTDRTEIGDPSVPIATDGFFVNRPYTVGNSFYDVQRLEVLKGPQGTLFGRNSTGGLINILENQPTDTFGGYADVSVGKYETVNSEGAVNVPLTSWADMRISGQQLYDDGYRKLAGENTRGDDANSQSGYEHTFDVGTNGQITGRFDGKYSSHYYFDVFNFPDTRQGSFFTGNLSATYTPAQGKWRLEAYICNFTNAVTFAYAARNWNSDYNTYEFNPPLTFGARVHYAF